MEDILSKPLLEAGPKCCHVQSSFEYLLEWSTSHHLSCYFFQCFTTLRVPSLCLTEISHLLLCPHYCCVPLSTIVLHLLCTLPLDIRKQQGDLPWAFCLRLDKLNSLTPSPILVYQVLCYSTACKHHSCTGDLKSGHCAPNVVWKVLNRE